MNEAIKARWIEALTGREYRQGRFSLHRPWPHANIFSAAGVLCELHRLETGTDHWRGPDGNGDCYYLDNPYYIPQEVRDWAGMPERWPIDLGALDRRGASFAEIAAEIAGAFVSAIDRARLRFQELLRRGHLTPDELEEVAFLTAYIAEYITTEARHATTTRPPA